MRLLLGREFPPTPTDGPERVGYSPAPTKTEFDPKCRDGVSGWGWRYLHIAVQEYSILIATPTGGDVCRKGHCTGWGSGVYGDAGGDRISGVCWGPQDPRAKIIGDVIMLGRSGFWRWGGLISLAILFPSGSPAVGTAVDTGVCGSAHTKKWTDGHPIQSGLLLLCLTEHETRGARIRARLLSNDNSHHHHHPLLQLDAPVHSLLDFAQDDSYWSSARPSTSTPSWQARCRTYSGTLGTDSDPKDIMTLLAAGWTLVCVFDSWILTWITLPALLRFLWRGWVRDFCSYSSGCSSSW